MHADLLPHATLTSDKIIVLEEKKVKVSLDNPGQDSVFRIKVDGGVITDVERVDCALRREGTGDLLVELKGSDIEKACDQVRSTIARWKGKKYQEGRLSALVISHRRPNVATEWQIKSKKILDDYGVVTKFESSGKTLRLIDLLPAPDPKIAVTPLPGKRPAKSHHKKAPRSK